VYTTVDKYSYTVIRTTAYASRRIKLVAATISYRRKVVKLNFYADLPE